MVANRSGTNKTISMRRLTIKKRPNQKPKKPTGKELIKRAEMAMKEYVPGDEKPS